MVIKKPDNTKSSEITDEQTLFFNGYAEQIKNLYSGMDLKKYF